MVTVAGAAYNPQGSTAAMNAAGFLDTTAGRAAFAASQAGGGGAAGGGAVGGAQQGFNPQAAQIAAQLADNAAQREYLRARLNLDSDIEAHRQAQQVWQNTFDQAKFEYQKTQDAQTFGLQQQTFGLQQAGVTGYYQAPVQPVDPSQFAAQDQATKDIYLQYNGNNPQAAAAKWAQDATKAVQQASGPGTPTLAREAQQNQTSLDYLKLISGLSGPSDYGSYLRTLGSTPGGLRDLVASAAGKYVPATGASTGVAPQAASLGGLVNAAATGQSGGTNYADYMQAAQGLPSGNQISPDAWNAFTTSQKQALLGMYGQRGDVPQDVQDLYQQSLPKYAYSGSPTGSVKL